MTIKSRSNPPARKTKKKSANDLLCVQILEAKPNPLFTDEQRSWLRFLRFSRPTPCAACGKKLRIHWTMLCEFKAGDTSGPSFQLGFYPQTFAPLTAVCGDHPLKPAVA